MGAPSMFDREQIVQRVIAGLEQGTPLTVLCREEGMPSDRSIRYWIEEDPNIASAIADAREVGFDQIALDALAIADETANDTLVSEEGAARPNSEWITRSRLRVETRLKLLAKWDPKRYGERTTLAGDPDAPLAVPTNEQAIMTELASLLGPVLAALPSRDDTDDA